MPYKGITVLLLTLLTVGPTVQAQVSGHTVEVFDRGATRGVLNFRDSSGNAVTLKLGAALSGNVALTLPNNDGTANQCLVTDGSGALTFADCAAAGTYVTLTGHQSVDAKTFLGATMLRSTSDTLEGLRVAGAATGEYFYVIANSATDTARIGFWDGASQFNTLQLEGVIHSQSTNPTGEVMRMSGLDMSKYAYFHIAEGTNTLRIGYWNGSTQLNPIKLEGIIETWDLRPVLDNTYYLGDSTHYWAEASIHNIDAAPVGVTSNYTKVRKLEVADDAGAVAFWDIQAASRSGVSNLRIRDNSGTEAVALYRQYAGSPASFAHWNMSLVPNGTHTLGTAVAPWDEAWVGDLNVSGTVSGNIVSTNTVQTITAAKTFDGITAQSVGPAGTVGTGGTATLGSALAVWYEAYISTINSYSNSPLILRGAGYKYLPSESPHVAWYKKSGAECYYWRYTNSGLPFTAGEYTIMEACGSGGTNNLYLYGGILPTNNNLYDIGSYGYRWKDGWFGGTVTADGLYAVANIDSPSYLANGQEVITGDGDGIFRNVTVTGTFTGTVPAPANMVTTDTTQTITGDKTFGVLNSASLDVTGLSYLEGGVTSLQYDYYHPGAPLDEKRWRWHMDGTGWLRFQSVTDSYAGADSIFGIQRTAGMTTGPLEIYKNLQVSGAATFLSSIQASEYTATYAFSGPLVNLTGLYPDGGSPLTPYTVAGSLTPAPGGGVVGTAARPWSDGRFTSLTVDGTLTASALSVPNLVYKNAYNSWTGIQGFRAQTQFGEIGPGLSQTIIGSNGAITANGMAHVIPNLGSTTLSTTYFTSSSSSSLGGPVAFVSGSSISVWTNFSLPGSGGFYSTGVSGVFTSGSCSLVFRKGIMVLGTGTCWSSGYGGAE